MTATILPRPAGARPLGATRVRVGVVLVLAVWFVLVTVAGSLGAFIGRPGTPPIALGIGFGAPLLLFFASFWTSRPFREFVLSIDLRLITGLQAWRWAGFGFLSLYALNVLPAMFALPAGLGDMTISFAAPWMILGLVRRPGFAASPAFICWNVLGILDLVLAVSLGTSIATFYRGTAGEISTAPMAAMPLLLIPAFFVPLFLMLHATALMQSRQLVRSRGA